MTWILAIPALWFLGTKAIWLYALDATIKQQRHIRILIYPGDVRQFEGMDHHKLDNLTYELQELGFVVLGDLLSEMGQEPDPTSEGAPAAPPPSSRVNTETRGIARILINREKGCYATLVSVIAVAHFPASLNRAPTVKVAPFRTAILSLSGNDEDSWGFGTTNRAAEPFSLLHRHPRQLSHRLVGADARALLQSHLTEREEIAKRGDFRWNTPTTLDEYRVYEERGIRFIRSIYENATALGIAWKLQILRLQNHERWMGELGSR
jgi:hypothetical protein